MCVEGGEGRGIHVGLVDVGGDYVLRRGFVALFFSFVGRVHSCILNLVAPFP